VYGSRRGTADGSRASWPAVPDGDLVARAVAVLDSGCRSEQAEGDRLAG
jgi:hypothetical protein